MPIANRSLKEFIFTAKCGELNNDETAKDRWHRLARRVIRVLAEHIGLDRSEYDMWTNKGEEVGPGVTVMHTQTFCVKFEISSFSRDIGFMFKRCNGRKDFVGGTTHYMKWEKLLSLRDVADRLLQHARGD